MAQKDWIEARLEQVFQRWGYHRIITPTLESIDTLMAGGAIDQATVIEVQAAGQQRLGLRPELTASIARTAVTRLARVTYPSGSTTTLTFFAALTKAATVSSRSFTSAALSCLERKAAWPMPKACCCWSIL